MRGLAVRAVIVARFGAGEVVRRTPDPAEPGNRNLDAVVVRYPALSLVARFPTDEASTGVTRLSTRNARHRMAAGAGVGSSRAAVRAAHPAAVCTASVCQLGPPPPAARSRASCSPPASSAWRFCGVPPASRRICNERNGDPGDRNTGGLYGAHPGVV